MQPHVFVAMPFGAKEARAATPAAGNTPATGAVIVDFNLVYQRLITDGKLTSEQVIVVLAGLYLFIRYGLAALFKRLTVHRGMYHSVPAMLIAGLAVHLLYSHPSLKLRLYLAGGVMVGFLSHLVLDELYSVDFMGVRVHLKKSAGSAVKFWSSDWAATAGTYLLLLGLAFAAWVKLDYAE